MLLAVLPHIARGVAFGFGRVGGKQPAPDLNAGSFRLRLGDEPTLAVALDLGELIAIDGSVERVARSVTAPGAGERPQQDEQHDRRQARENHIEQHASLRLVSGHARA